MRLVFLATALVACGTPDPTSPPKESTPPTGVGPVDADGDGITEAEDCDDQDAAVYPGAVESCDDAVDLNCDGLPGNLDADGDGAPACDDCDDSDPAVSPGAAESCNDKDDNCDGAVDEGAYEVWLDQDGDGYGSGASTLACGSLPSGYATSDTDCDDLSADVYPGAPETCDDPTDLNCDGSVGNVDADGDGWRACEECDDGDIGVHPDATEVCNGGIDDNCDGSADGSDADGALTWYRDDDGDGWGTSETADACEVPTGYTDHDGDCDDTNATCYPAGVEVEDSADNDCDSWVDEDFILEGDVIFSEVHRQPRFGETSTQSDGMWFEVYNTSSRDIYLDNWYVVRDAPISGVEVIDSFQIDPAADVLVPAGGYAVLCKTDDYEGSSTASYPLWCDYVWGNEAEESSASGLYWDNTFNLQRDEDELFLIVGLGGVGDPAIDSVHWTYDDTNGYWPRDARYSMSLDPTTMTGGQNDDLNFWCSTSAAVNDPGWTWYDSADTDDDEHGTPGATNQACP